MIAFFNRIGNSWVAKGIFFLLGLSMMAFWGLGGISNTSTSDGTALQVGKNKVPLKEVSYTFDQERNKMAKISGGYMTPKRAIQAGLLDQVVQQLALRELNAQIQEEIGLTASDDAVRKYIERNPVFKDALGKFDANLFYAYLSQLNISQSQLAQQLRSELATQHLIRTIESAVPRDPKLMALAAQAKKEKREVISVLLTPENVALSVPDNQELKDYYEAYMEEFGVPEYRNIRLVSLKPADFGNDYNQMYSVSRQLEDLLGAGKSLKDACSELNLNAGEIFVTDISGKDKKGQKIKKIEPVLQEMITLSEGEATSLVDVESGFMVASVEKITPRGYKNFDDVKNEVIKLWQREQQKSALNKSSDDLLSEVQKGKGWKKYSPSTSILSATNTSFPKEITSVLLQQKVGPENAKLFSTEKGNLIAYVKRIIPSTEEPSEKEKLDAVQDWGTDLGTAVRQAYAQKYPTEIHTNTIQKAFSIYENQED